MCVAGAVGMVRPLSLVGGEQIRGAGSRGQPGGQEAAVGAPATVGAVGQEAGLSKLPAERPPHRRGRAGPGGAALQARTW